MPAGAAISRGYVPKGNDAPLDTAATASCWTGWQITLEASRHNKVLIIRKCWVETVNADLKNNYTLGRARYRGNLAVHIQALMAACACNVCQLVKHLKTLIKHPPALAQLRQEEARMCLVG